MAPDEDDELWNIVHVAGVEENDDDDDDDDDDDNYSFHDDGHFSVSSYEFMGNVWRSLWHYLNFPLNYFIHDFCTRSHRWMYNNNITLP